MSEEKHPSERSVHPWRENLEGLALAVIMALTLKYFVIEAYKIPTGSMQPTLMGVDLPELQIFDRILVDKLSLFLREPQRWEVLVFKFPLDQSKNYIKRLVGMPGETVQIQNGNIYAKSAGQPQFHIARKPPNIQETLWKEVYRSDGTDVEGENPEKFWITDSGKWQLSRNQFRSEGPGKLRYRHPIKDYYLDGYPESIKPALSRSQRDSGSRFVGDLRFSTRVKADEKLESLEVSLRSGENVFACSLSGPSGNGSAILSLNGHQVAQGNAKLIAGRESALRFSHVDEAMQLELDGQIVLRHEIPGCAEMELLILRNSIEVETKQGGATFSKVQLDRDLFYAQGGPQSEWVIPQGEYFFLGDNTQNSYDGRVWRESAYKIAGLKGNEDALQLRGDGGASDQNPRVIAMDQGDNLLLFTDVYGENYRFHSGSIQDLEQHNASFVSRDSLVGRAFFVFWPAPPFSPVLRWKIIH